MAYRTRKEGGILSSLVGMLIGFALVVIGSPLAAWYAESQHRAEDFSSATVVDAQSTQSGYIIIEDQPIVKEPLVCPTGKVEAVDADTTAVSECLYVAKVDEEYSVEQKEQCGTLNSNQEQVAYLGEECDADGANCEPCYRVNEYTWKQISETAEYAKIGLGQYVITPSESTNFIGGSEMVVYDVANLGTEANPEVSDSRFSYEYFPVSEQLLVAGDSENGKIKGAYDKKPYVVSNYSYQGTLAELEAQDTGMKWGLRILSLVLMVFGAVLIVGPLTVFTNVFRFVPFVGKHVDKGVDAVISFFAALVGVAMWVVVYGLVLVLKNVWIILIVLGVLGFGIIMLVQRGKHKQNTTDSNQPPTTPPVTS